MLLFYLLFKGLFDQKNKIKKV